MKHENLSPTIIALLQGRASVDANWCQGFGQDPLVCAVEALRRARDQAYDHGPIAHYSTAFKCLHLSLPSSWHSVVHYNDAKGRTKEDILALYDRAIDLALKDEQ